MRSISAPLLLFTALFLVSAPIARAQEAAEEPSSEIFFDLTAGTHFPLSIGVEGQLELPYRILAQVHLGWMPGPYFDVINSVIVGLGGYNEATAAVVAAAVESSFIMRISAGVS